MRATIVIASHVREYVRDFERLTERALERSAPIVERAVRDLETRVKTGALKESIRSTPVKNGTRFIGYTVGSPLFYARFHEYGTLGRRRKKLAQPGRRRLQAEAGSGIKPLHFFAKGLRTSFPEVVAILKVELRKLG